MVECVGDHVRLLHDLPNGTTLAQKIVAILVFPVTKILAIKNHSQTVATGFEAKPAKTIRLVLRPNHSQTIDLGFEAQLRNSRS
jgi:hypothetical protein